MRKILLAGLCSLLSSGMAVMAGEDVSKDIRQVWDGSATMVVPLLTEGKAPTIDGNLSEAEWAQSVKVAGFIQHPGDKGLIKGKSGFAYFMADQEYIYLAVRTSTPNFDPGGGLVALAKDRDGNVWADDSVEIMINPDTDRETTYHLIANCQNVLFDRKVGYNPDQSDLSWNIRGMKLASNAGSGWWTMEAAIPRREISNPKDGVSINVARNWSGIGPSALIPTESHVNRQFMFTMTWKKEAVPVLKMEDLGAPDEGDWSVKLSARNIPKGHKCLLAGELVSRHYPAGKPAYVKRVDYQQRELSADGELVLKGQAETDEIHSLYVLLKDLTDGKVLFHRTFNARKGMAVEQFPVSGMFELPNAGSGVLFNYHGYDKSVIALRLKSSLNPVKVTVSTRLPDGSVRDSAVRYEERKWKATVPGGPQAGRYEHSLSIVLKDGRKLSFPAICSFERKSFVWENNRLGMDKVIVPPFTPIAIAGNQVDMLYRKHRLNASGLWDSLLAKDRELLAAPMHFRVEVSGQSERLKGAVRSIESPDSGYSAATQNQVSSASGVGLQIRTEMDYDGFFYNRVRILNPQKRKISRLTLVVPLKEGEARLLHGVADTIRSNPTGNIPAGQGVVWTGDKVPHNVAYGKQVLHPQFLPYFWLGTEERGISYMATSSYGMRLAKEISAVRVIRKSPVVTLEIDFINVPTVTEQGDGFAFGLMATPVKPIDRELLRYITDDRGGKIPGMKYLHSIYNELAGYHRFFREPHKGDYGLCEAMSRMLREGGSTVKAFDLALKHWDDRYLKDVEQMYASYKSPDNDGKTYMTWWKRVRNTFNSFQHTAVANRTSLPVIYSDPRLIAHLEPTGKYFLSEWCYGDLGYTYTYRSYPTRTNLDYMVYCYAQQIKHGIPGIYLDDMWICPNYNTDTEAKIDCYGQMHAETGLLQLRELVRRIAVIQYQQNCRPRYMEIHMTNALLVPCFSMATAQLGWEDKYGESEFQERFKEDAIRAINMGVKIGAVPRALDGIYRQTTPFEVWKKDLFPFLNRTMMAMILPHDIRPLQRLNGASDGIDWDLVTRIYTRYGTFGTWEDDCRFVPYYLEDGCLAGVPQGVWCSSYRRPGRILIVLGSQKEAKTFALKIDRKKLGIPADAILRDGETGKPVDGNRIQLPRRDFRLLLLGADDAFNPAP